MSELFDILNDHLQDGVIPRDDTVIHDIDRLKYCKEFLRDAIKTLPALGALTVTELYEELDKYS